MLDINIGAAILAAVSSFMLGGLWYSPVLFGKKWIKETEFDEANAGHPAKVFGLSFIFALMAAFGFAIVIGPQPDMMTAIYHAILIGIMFVATSFGINYQFSNKSFSLFFIDAGYHVCQFITYAVILGAWH
ncbi:DUF1761 domain-containing protein [Thalassotalea atypica]|uniref:DUF1761 domain-containing protein n=1 Tax=Thalassotalea atypica TaxID=2054316 RepID=UPI002572B58E|nr:DUF1761 domain-containing protein [Thalassotalea atypica]